jgi:hypothetical protein
LVFLLNFIKGEKGDNMTPNIQVSVLSMTGLCSTGLCINCINKGNCTYQLNQTKPIIFCEEFSCADEFGSENKPVCDHENEHCSMAPLPQGICCSCDNLETCCLQRSGEIVFDCEEYT